MIWFLLVALFVVVPFAVALLIADELAAVRMDDIMYSKQPRALAEQEGRDDD